MSRQKLKLQNWDSEQIIELFKKDDRLKLGLKLFAVYLVSLGRSTREVENLYNIHFSFKQISNWVHSFDLNGLAGLEDKPKTGRLPKLEKSEQDELKQIILTTKPTDFGIKAQSWTGTAVGLLIEKRFNVQYKRAQIYNVLKKLGLE